MEVSMESVRTIWISCLAVLVVSMLAGCAKRPAAVTEAAQAPPPVAVAQPEPPKAITAEVVDLDSLISRVVVHFDFDQAVLRSEDQQKLQKLAEALRSSPSAKIRVSGNCDERGTEEYNLALGQRRAEVARKYLIDLGIERVRIDTVSYGHEKPVDPRHSEDAWAANRRDEFASLRGN
jgi:peptidoglycan-associated lipoprotein